MRQTNPLLVQIPMEHIEALDPGRSRSVGVAQPPLSHAHGGVVGGLKNHGQGDVLRAKGQVVTVNAIVPTHVPGETQQVGARRTFAGVVGQHLRELYACVVGDSLCARVLTE